MPGLSKKIVEKILQIKILGKPSQLRPRPPWTFLSESAKWMLAAPGATALPQNLPRIIFETKAPFCSAFTRHELCLLIAPSPPRPKDLAGTTRRVGAIAAHTASSFRTLRWPLESTKPRPWLETIMIMGATGQRVGKTRNRLKSLVTIITRRDILLTNALNSTSQKTSINLGNLHIGDRY